MICRAVAVVLGAAATITACSTTTGVATAPDRVTPLTSTTPSRKAVLPPEITRTVTAPPGAPGLTPEAFAEVRAAGVDLSDGVIIDQTRLACIMGEGSFVETRQDLAKVLVYIGSQLRPAELAAVIDVAIKYECPQLSDKLG
ncbi:hypothetical protein ACWDUN_15025 [Mycobacterium sp. NPDC003323]